MANINIGIPIDLEKLISTRLLVQAGSGGGKSYALRKLMESISGKCQQIILDPEGEFVTLREKFDFAYVAKGGDIPLSLKYAEMLAHKLLETSLSAIIDLYELKQHERVLFVKRFLDALMNAPKALWHSCIVYVDEAHIFCPESSKSESMASVIDLCTRGRKRGFAAVLATQRLSKLHKDAAAECLNKMIGRTGLDIDRKRAGDELGMVGKVDMISLRELQPGEFFTFGPAISNEVSKFKVSAVSTTHIQAGKKSFNVPPIPDAIKKILTKLQDIPEEAEKELQSKQQLQGEVTRLRGELTKVGRATSVNTNDSVLKNEIQDLLSKVKASSGQVTQMQKVIREMEARMNKAVAVLSNEPTALPAPIAAAPTPSVTGLPVQSSRKKVAQPVADGDYKPGKCDAAIAGFLSTFPDRTFSLVQVGIATGYSAKSGGFNNSLGKLNSAGYIIRGNGRLQINPDADLSIFPAYDQKIHPSETFASKLGKCEREIYEVLLSHPNDVFTIEQIAASTPSQYSHTSGGFNNALGRLNTMELIIRAKGTARINPEILEI